MPGIGRVLQFPNDILNRNVERSDKPPRGALIGYAPFSTALERLQERIKNGAVLQQGNDLIGFDFGETNTLAKLLLCYCVLGNRHGVTLFSTTRPERLKNLVRAVSDEEVTEEHISKFCRLVDKWCCQ
jgi:hypothetical protein